jgi:hypothetical protein
MVDIINGRDTAPLAGWVIAQVHGVALIGEMRKRPIPTEVLSKTGVVIGFTPGPHGEYLSPVFEMKPNIVQVDRAGNQAAIHPCFPLWLLGVEEIDLPAGALVFPVEKLHPRERKELVDFVKNAEETMKAMKLAHSGISLAHAGTKLPAAPVKG